jgi:hypothetical protein
MSLENELIEQKKHRLAELEALRRALLSEIKDLEDGHTLKRVLVLGTFTAEQLQELIKTSCNGSAPMHFEAVDLPDISDEELGRAVYELYGRTRWEDLSNDLKQIPISQARTVRKLLEGRPSTSAIPVSDPISSAFPVFVS